MRAGRRLEPSGCAGQSQREDDPCRASLELARGREIPKHAGPEEIGQRRDPERQQQDLATTARTIAPTSSSRRQRTHTRAGHPASRARSTQSPHATPPSESETPSSRMPRSSVSRKSARTSMRVRKGSRSAAKPVNEPPPHGAGGQEDQVRCRSASDPVPCFGVFSRVHGLSCLPEPRVLLRTGYVCEHGAKED